VSRPPSAPRIALRPPSGREPPTAAVAELIRRLDERHGALSANLIGFARVLRAAGLNPTPGRVLDAGRSLLLLDLARIEDVRAALMANLLADHAQTGLFNLLFDRYWLRARGGEDAPVVQPPDTPPDQHERTGSAGELVAALPRPAAGTGDDHPEGVAGDAELLTVKDFSTYTDDDLKRARRLVRALAPKLATVVTRRRRPSHRRDEIDLRASVRRAARHGGEVLRLLYRRKQTRRLRLVLLLDVSGSMDRYSRALVQFLYALRSEVRGVSTFVFSTRLHDVTPMLKTRSFDDALARLSRGVDAWSGGTSIGRCLAQFEREYARGRIDRRTVVVLMSDGWERGDVGELERAMAGLRRRARRIVWLNPLLGVPGYRPVARGMAAALPYVDDFLPAHNLEALARAIRTLAGA
jgi:uncharacterized protein